MDSGSRAGAERAALGDPVKPEVSGAVSESWLDEFDQLRSEYLIRLEADRTIIAELRDAGFAGAHYTYFETELAKYGIAVLTAWIVTHQIFAKMRQRGRGLTPPQGEELRNQDTALELAMETVAVALANFKSHVLVPGRWDPDKGASIRTYFIGQCLLQFGNVYRRWLEETFDSPPWDELYNQATMASRGYEHVEEKVVALTAADIALGGIKKVRTKEIFILVGAGHTHLEIAGRLGITVKTVEMTIANERKRRQEGEAG